MSATETSYYGAYQYGTFFYGVDPALIHQSDYFVPMTATPNGYSSVQISWQRPNAPNITKISLRRAKFNLPNDFNTPTDSDDGVEVFNGLSATSFTDTGLFGGGFFYYTLFGFDSTVPPFQQGQSTGLSPWRRLGSVIALVPLSYNYGNFLYNRLPGWMRDSDLLLVNGLPESDILPLAGLTGLLGFQLDEIRSYIDSLLLINDPHNCNGSLLPYICQQLGMPYEIKMGMAQARKLAADAVHLYRIKGTAPGISEFCSDLTGWPTQTTFMGPNRLLSIDGGVFANSVGGWSFPTTATVPGFPAISLPTNGNAAVSLAHVTLPGGVAPFPNYSNSGASTVLSTGGKITVNSVPANPNLFMVGAALPANDFLNDEGVGTLVLPIWFWTAATGQSVTLELYDEAGTLLNSSTTAITASTANTPSMTTAINLSTDTDQPRWLIPIIKIAGAANTDVYYITEIAAYNATAPTLYDLPRDLKIVLEPASANLFGNPLTFASTYLYGLDGWVSKAATNNLGVVVPTSPAPTFGAAVLQVSTVNVAGSYQVPQVQGGQIQTLTIESGYVQNPSNFQGVPITANLPHTFSVYVAAPSATVGKSFNLGFNFTLSTGQVITQMAGPFTVSGTFQRFSVTEIAPALTISVTAFFTSTDPNLGPSDLFFLNAAMLEQSSAPDSYFDVWTAGIDPDYRVGTNGQSMFYENLGVRLPRLQTLLPQWIPSNATYTIFLALGATVPGSSSYSPAAGTTFPLTLPAVI